jgi:D-serine deaminase-like pyridoxal phosphate-dependent protein
MTSYQVRSLDSIPSPSLLLFLDVARRNIQHMVEIAGDINRLRPHCKTHKIEEITKMQLEMGMLKHKCATLAEAEMLANAGCEDIFLAYNMVGPNIQRAVKFREKFPNAKLIVTADHPKPTLELAAAMVAANTSVEVAVDIDNGYQRTGIASPAEAAELYQLIDKVDGLELGGFHLYDGQNHQKDLDDRLSAVMKVWEQGQQVRELVQAHGLHVPRIVAGGTGSFPVFADIEDDAMELSPGTTVLHDCGYQDMFPDMDFTPAALVLSRVISMPGESRLTLDCGSKAIASDPPMGNRLSIPELPDAVQVIHNEEHLVIETSQADSYEPGDALLLVPRHVCPTSALHQQVYVIENGECVANWKVVGRDRVLTI